MAKKIDWAYVKPLFRAGYSLRAIRAKYEEAHGGESVSIEAIRRAAKRFGWKKDLTKDIAEAVDRKLAEATADTEDGASQELSDEEVVDKAAAEATGVVLTHRQDGQKLRKLVSDLTAELEAEKVEERVVGRGAHQKVVKVRVALKDKATAVRNLAFALGRAVDIERKSHNLDRADGSADGVFVIKSKIPEPDPLPEDI